MNTINSKRLREARLYRKQTMEELATAVGVNKQAISQFENDKAAPDPMTLKKIADTLDFPYAFFGQQKDATLVGNTYFRSLYSSSKKDQAAQQIKATYLSRIYSVLKEYVIFKPLNIPRDLVAGSIEKLAYDVREDWGLGDQPIPNMVALLEKHGIVVGEFSTDGRDIDAFYQYSEINGEPMFCVILGADKRSFFRRQFNCAHELGHILLHERYQDLSELSRDEYRAREDQANAFASAFLLPANAFARDVSVYPNRLSYYVELKKKWCVSMAAMIMRAKSLEIITANQYTYLMRQISSKGYRMEEPLDSEIPYRHPKALHQAVNGLIMNGKLTGSQLLDRIASAGLALSPSVAGELLNLPQELFYSHFEQDNILAFPQKNN